MRLTAHLHSVLDEIEWLREKHGSDPMYVNTDHYQYARLPADLPSRSSEQEIDAARNCACGNSALGRGSCKFARL